MNKANTPKIGTTGDNLKKNSFTSIYWKKSERIRTKKSNSSVWRPYDHTMDELGKV